MMNRRHFLGANLVLATGPVFMPGALAQAIPALPPALQGEYLFWLSEIERKRAQDAGYLVVNQLDAIPLDTQAVSGIYGRGAKSLKFRMTSEKFVTEIMRLRAAKGIRRDRVFQAVRGGYRLLSELPEGEYCIVAYDTLFDGDNVIYSEQLTMERGSHFSGQWELASYYLGVKAFYPKV